MVSEIIRTCQFSGHRDWPRIGNLSVCHMEMGIKFTSGFWKSFLALTIETLGRGDCLFFLWIFFFSVVSVDGPEHGIRAKRIENKWSNRSQIKQCCILFYSFSQASTLPVAK